MLLDCDGAQRRSVDTAISVNALLKKLDKEGHDKKLRGICTDNGGSGTGDSFATALGEVDRVDNKLFFMVTCMIHALQQMVAGPIEVYCGPGGLKTDTLLQMVHTAYNLQQQHEARNGRKCG